MENHFWGIEGRKKWPAPHNDLIFLAKAALDIGTKRFNDRWVGAAGKPHGAQMDWVRDFILSHAGDGSLTAVAFNPFTKNFEKIEPLIWIDKRLTKSVFSRCQIVIQDPDEKNWGSRPAYQDVFFDRLTYKKILKRICVEPLPKTSTEKMKLFKSDYLDLVLEMAEDLHRLEEEKENLKIDGLMHRSTLWEELARRTFYRLNLDINENEFPNFQKYGNRNKYSKNLVDAMIVILRGSNHKDQKGRPLDAEKPNQAKISAILVQWAKDREARLTANKPLSVDESISESAK